MRRRREEELDAGSDSFLDIVANMVGILIILVMVVGVRVGNAPAKDESPEPVEVEQVDVPQSEEQLPAEPQPEIADAALLDEVRTLASSAGSLEAEVLGLARQVKELEDEASLRGKARAALAVVVERKKRDLAEKRRQLDAEQQRLYDARRMLNQAREQLARVQSAIVFAEQKEPPAIEIVSYPTPISQTVHGKEAHFQLRAGRIAYVPIDELLAALRSSSSEIMEQLRAQAEAKGTVGPRDDFRMAYRFRRVTVAERPGQRGGTYAELAEFQMLPSRALLGESLSEAMAGSSQFRGRLAAYDPARTTVTLWVYPDSFDEFRALKKELYRLGYSIAGRPLPHGTPIMGSPQGSRSSAQ